MKKTKQLVIFTATIFCSFIIFIGYEYTPSEFTRVRSSSISYLTGRPKIWTASITLAKERPILGYGYSVGGKIFQDRRFHDARLETWSGNPRASLHNGYLSVFIGLGSIGLSLFCISLFFPLWNCFQAPVSPHRAFVLSIISMALLVNWFETAIVGGRSIDSVMMWIAWVVAATENRVDGVIKSKFV